MLNVPTVDSGVPMELRDAAVLVTGGSGMLGSQVVERLLRADVPRVTVLDDRIQTVNLAEAMASGRVHAIEGDIRDARDIDAALDGVQAIVHTAAVLTAATGKAPHDGLMINVVGSHELLRKAGEAGVERIVLASSVGVYGSPSTDDVVLSETSLPNRPSLYGISKLTAEHYGNAFAAVAGYGILSLRFGTLYGPRMHRQGVVPTLLLDALDEADRGRTPTIPANPSDEHDFIYVEDAADAVIAALESTDTRQPVNVVSGESVTTHRFIRTALGLLGSGVEPAWAPPVERTLPARRSFSNRLAKELLGFTATTPLPEGLRRLLAWRAASKR